MYKINSRSKAIMENIIAMHTGSLYDYQINCITSLLSKNDTLALVRTGGGKTRISHIAGLCLIELYKENGESKLNPVVLGIIPLVSILANLPQQFMKLKKNENITHIEMINDETLHKGKKKHDVYNGNFSFGIIFYF